MDTQHTSLEQDQILEREKQLLPPDGTPFQGNSEAAARRRAWRERGLLHVAGAEGEIIKMSGGRKYEVAKDGSFRRVDKLKKVA